MRVLDLFSGIGGFSLGLERAGMETVAFCEIELFCQKVLAKHWPDVPIYSDITKLTKERLIEDGVLADTKNKRCKRREANTGREGQAHQQSRNHKVWGESGRYGSLQTQKGKDDAKTIDLICGGYPCQPFSHAGKREGAEDDRHLWPEMYRIIETVRPRWVIAENVAGHITMGLDAVLSDLEAANYAWWTFVIPACAVDARHRRDRVWIIANAELERSATGKAGEMRESVRNTDRNNSQKERGRDQFKCRLAGLRQDVADTNNQGLQGGWSEREGKERKKTTGYSGSGCEPYGRAWPVESGFCRVANGVPMRVDRLKSLGNAVVPQVVEAIGRAIMECQ